MCWSSLPPRDMLVGDVRAQVASLLMHEFTAGRVTSLSQQMIVDLLGVQRGTVNRVVRWLEDRGAVETGYAHLRLRDRRALMSAAGIWSDGAS